jgi:phosphoribosylaminoimidazole carboxylase
LSIELVPQRSQFRAQLDAILDKVPYPDFAFVPQFPSAIMLNILGGADVHSHEKLVSLVTDFYHPHANAALHLYGKASKPGRKIGHITAWGQSTVEQLSERISPMIQSMDEIRAERIGSTEKIEKPMSQSRKTPLVAVTMGSDSG